MDDIDIMLVCLSNFGRGFLDFFIFLVNVFFLFGRVSLHLRKLENEDNPRFLTFYPPVHLSCFSTVRYKMPLVRRRELPQSTASYDWMRLAHLGLDLLL